MEALENVNGGFSEPLVQAFNQDVQDENGSGFERTQNLYSIDTNF